MSNGVRVQPECVASRVQRDLIRRKARVDGDDVEEFVVPGIRRREPRSRAGREITYLLSSNEYLLTGTSKRSPASLTAPAPGRGSSSIFLGLRMCFPSFSLKSWLIRRMVICVADLGRDCTGKSQGVRAVAGDLSLSLRTTPRVTAARGTG
jgi:hypothetical protein